MSLSDEQVVQRVNKVLEFAAHTNPLAEGHILGAFIVIFGFSEKAFQMWSESTETGPMINMGVEFMFEWEDAIAKMEALGIMADNPSD